MSSLSSSSSLIPKPNWEHTKGLYESTLKATDPTSSCPVEYRIPGYLVNPEHLVKLLQEKFKGDYKVKLRNDNYFISTPERLTKHDLVRC
ncbi:uncharacterized protein F4812DRAFT_411638, partial [Daldinia caldariorum]|uniref:uncharacterized protein n=1 Tax=Daldinia caldariorum TaxID=326644 RepID=UPI002008C876